MQINYACPFWGCENDTPDAFASKVTLAGYDGIEIHLPREPSFVNGFMQRLDEIRKARPGFLFIPQQLTSPENEPVEAHIAKMKQKLLELAELQPSFINSQTGKDYYSFSDNCRVIEASLNMGVKTNTPIVHETHRGRFSFHAPTLVPYLAKFPELELAADFSHFCTVSESLLQGQEEFIAQIIPHVSHIPARVGQEQAPQVNDPRAPEWQQHLGQFIRWWQQIVHNKKAAGAKLLTITPEFGPVPYMPVLPLTQQPIGNQWEINKFMMETLKRVL